MKKTPYFRAIRLYARSFKQELKALAVAVFIGATAFTPTAEAFDFNRKISVDLFDWMNNYKGARGSHLRMDDIPPGSVGYLYSTSSGPADRANLPPVFNITPEYKLNLKAGWGYSCGRFDAFANVQAMVNTAIDKFKQLPQMYVQGVVSTAIAALPAYILNKINPSMYNVVTKNLDDAFKLFETNFQSCKQVEAAVANGENPFADLIRFSKAEKQAEVLDRGGKPIDEVQKEVNENPAEGVKTAGGVKKGGKGQEPINFVQEVLIAGYNNILGRASTTSMAAGVLTQPLAKTFKDPEEAWLYLEDTYGSLSMNVTSVAQSKGGATWQIKVTERKMSHVEALNQLVNNQIDRAEYEEKTGVVPVPAEIDAIRQLDAYARNIAVDAHARAESLRDARIRLETLAYLLRSGMTEPNIKTSTGYEAFSKQTWTVIALIETDLQRLTLSENQ